MINLFQGGGTLDKDELETALRLFGHTDNVAETSDATKDELNFQDFTNFMKNHLFDASASIDEQFIMFTNENPDSNPDELHIT